MRRFLPLGLFFVSVVFFGYVIFSAYFEDVKKSYNVNAKGSSVVPSFSMPSLDDKQNAIITEKDILPSDGKYTLLNYWATWCNTCREEFEYISELSAHTDLKMVGISLRDSKDNLLLYLKESGNPFDLVGMDDGTVAIDFGIRGVPTTYLINSSGVIVFHYFGQISPSYFNKVLKSLPGIKFFDS